MLTINQYSKNCYPQHTNSAKTQNKQFENTQSVPIKSNVHFYALKSYEKAQSIMLAKAKACAKTPRPITKESASKEFNELFTEYKQDLHETPLSDIELTVKELEQKHPKNKILSTMQQAEVTEDFINEVMRTKKITYKQLCR